MQALRLTTSLISPPKDTNITLMPFVVVVVVVVGLSMRKTPLGLLHIGKLDAASADRLYIYMKVRYNQFF